jgi:glutamyl/glutaminyl-tRNA synthetase
MMLIMSQHIKQLSRTRLAPTPSGFLHRGNILNFYLIWKLAKNAGMKILLRIDDLDNSRMRPAYIEDIFFVLDKLKIEWDEGPTGVDDFHKNWGQQDRIPFYIEFLQKLKMGNALYACSCARSKIGKSSYPGTCRNLNLSLDVNPWRACMSCGSDFLFGDEKVIVNQLEDPIVWRRELIPAYHIASIVDDIHFGVTHIVRGEDLLPATRTQLALAQMAHAFQFTEIQFYHHALLFDVNGQKISKSTQHKVVSILESNRFNDLESIKSIADDMFQELKPVRYFLKMPGK